MIDSSEVYSILQSDGHKAAFNYINNRLPFQQHTRITDTSSPNDILQFEREVQINACAIKKTLGGGQHGYLGITLSASRYARFSTTPFLDDCPEGSDTEKPTGTMNDVERAVLSLVRGVLLRKIHTSVHPIFHLYDDIFRNQLEPIHAHLSNIREHFIWNLSREERVYLAAKDRHWLTNWLNCRTSFEIQTQPTPTSFKIYGDSAYTSTAVNHNKLNSTAYTSTAVNNNKLNSTATAANNEEVVAPILANTTILTCTTLPTESQPSVNPEYQHNNIKGKGKSTDQQHRDPKQHIQQFREQLDRSDEKLQLLRQHLRTPPATATPSVKPNNNNQLSSPSTNNTATERDIKRTEYRNTKGKGSTKYEKRNGACNNNSGVNESNNQTTTALQQNSAVQMATKQQDQVPRVKNKEHQQVPRVNNQVKLEQNVLVQRVIVNHISSVEQQQQKSDSNNKSFQQQLPPILHNNKLPVVQKLDGKAGKAEKWKIACENGFGRMIPATVNNLNNKKSYST